MTQSRPSSTRQGHSLHIYRAVWTRFSRIWTRSPEENSIQKTRSRNALSNSQYHLSSREVRRVISVANDFRNQVLIRTLAETGLRRFELASLQVEDIRLAEGQIVVRTGKGNKSRVVPAGDALRASLRQLIEHRKTGPVFLSRANDALSTRQLNRIVAEAGRLAGVTNPNPKHQQLTCHLFRHTFARLWKEQRGSIETLSRILGHASASTTWSLYGTESLQDMQRNYRQTIKRIFPGEESSDKDRC